jgi:hypothetical protein
MEKAFLRKKSKGTPATNAAQSLFVGILLLRTEVLSLLGRYVAVIVFMRVYSQSMDACAVT